MSFTSKVKNEVSKIEELETEKISELSAIVYNGATIDSAITITTENASVARRIFSLFKKIYEISPKITVRKGYNYNKNYIYILQVNNKKEEVLTDLSIIKNGKKNLIPDDYLIADDEEKRAYIRGLFLMSGSINDPKKSRYHLEFIVSTEKYANFIKELLNSYNLNSKVLKRENKYMVYVKEAEKIGDFLRIIKASNAVLYYEDIRIYRDHKNMTNRLNNCEQANVDKIIMSAHQQVKDIELIEEFGGLDLLDERGKIVATYRKKYNEASLLELSEIITIETGQPLSKSGIHHRFKKIKDLANRIREINK